MNKKTLITTGTVITFIVFLVIIFTLSTKDTPDVAVEVQRGTIAQEVSASGKVESPTQIDLRFKNSGKLIALNAIVGETVTEGQLLATQDTAYLDAQVWEMQTGIDLQKAKLEQLIAGASNEETTVSQTSLVNAKRDYENTKAAQAVLVESAYKTLLNSTIEAIPDDGTSNYAAPTISGNYNLGREGVIYIAPYSSSGGTSYRVTGLVSDTGTVDEVIAQPIGNTGLYIMFPDAPGLGSTDWVINIPNKDAFDYLKNYNAYQAALQTQQSALASAQALVDLREAELTTKEAPTRSTDIAVYEAQINQAVASLQKVYAQRADLMIFAPAASTITAVNGVVGETIGPDATVISLAAGGALQIKLNVVEDNIVNVKVGQEVKITFDAIEDVTFNGKVIAIDPAETIVGGAVYYETTILFDTVDERIRSGMTANVWIKTSVSENTLFVPMSALQNKNGKKIVLVQEGKEIVEKEVKTGLKNDAGMIEIVSGLTEGEQIILGSIK